MKNMKGMKFFFMFFMLFMVEHLLDQNQKLNGKGAN
jgi:hypothetical protein